MEKVVNYGEGLRRLRLIMDYGQKELAEQLEISSSYLSELEAGKKQGGITIELFAKYAAWIGGGCCVSTITDFCEDLVTDQPTAQQRVIYALRQFIKNLDRVR